MADTMKRWNGSEWVPVLNVDRSVIERVVEIVGHGTITIYTDIIINCHPETFEFAILGEAT